MGNDIKERDIDRHPCKGNRRTPSETKELERMIRDMIDASGCPEIPPLWGNCYEENEE